MRGTHATTWHEQPKAALTVVLHLEQPTDIGHRCLGQRIAGIRGVEILQMCKHGFDGATIRENLMRTPSPMVCSLLADPLGRLP